MTTDSLPSFARAIGDSLLLEVDDAGGVTLVIVPIDVRAIIPHDVFCRFAIAVADVLGHLNHRPTCANRATRRSKQ